MYFSSYNLYLYNTVLSVLFCVNKDIITTQDSPLCRVIQNMLSSMRFYRELNNERSRWEETEERLAMGKCPVPILFNIYTDDQPLHNRTRSFIYADDICVTTQQPFFVEVETTIEESLSELTQYYRSNNLRANPDKTQVTAFHMRNKEAKKTLKVKWNRTDLEKHPTLSNNNNNCLKSNIQCIEIRVQWTVHLGSSHMHVHAVTRVHAVTPKLVICVMYLTSI